MRNTRRVAMAIGLAAPFLSLASVASSASTDCMDKLFSEYARASKAASEYQRYTEADGKMQSDPRYATCAKSKQSSRNESSVTKRSTKQALASAALPSAAMGASAAVPFANTQRTYFLLRQDFADVWLFQTPGDGSEATGADISFTSDRIAKNDKVSGQGMASVVWQAYGDYGRGAAPGFLGLSIGPYVQIDYLHNSSTALTNSNSEIWTYGGLAEVGIDAFGGQHYFRGRGAAVSDRITDVTTNSAVFEWIPVYRDWNIGSPSVLPLPIPIIYRFSPELKVRYDSLPIADGSTAREYEWRFGPQATLVYKLYQGEMVPEFFRRISGRTTYSHLYSANSDRVFSWLETSLTYNIDAEGHLGLTASYKKGRFEETAMQTDLYRLSLAAKW